MKKISTLFERDPEHRSRVLTTVTPGCEWVLAGEGAATRKWEGTHVSFDGTDWWARREVKPDQTAPDDFVLEVSDEVTGKDFGRVPAETSAWWKMLREVLEANPDRGWLRGGYELMGPKINQNPQRFDRHRLERHEDAPRVEVTDRSYAGIRYVVLDRALARWEGLVFHHPDGRMAKIKARDFR